MLQPWLALFQALFLGWTAGVIWTKQLPAQVPVFRGEWVLLVLWSLLLGFSITVILRAGG